MTEPTGAGQRTLRADAGPALTDAHGHALPAILQMAAETEAETGRYRFPMLPDDTVRVAADCSCGWAMDGPERVWTWLSGRHAHAHNKGVDGLAAGASWTVRHITAEQPEPEPEAGQ